MNADQLELGNVQLSVDWGYDSCPLTPIHSTITIAPTSICGDACDGWTIYAPVRDALIVSGGRHRYDPRTHYFLIKYGDVTLCSDTIRTTILWPLTLRDQPLLMVVVRRAEITVQLIDTSAHAEQVLQLRPSLDAPRSWDVKTSLRDALFSHRLRLDDSVPQCSALVHQDAVSEISLHSFVTFQRVLHARAVPLHMKLNVMQPPQQPAVSDDF